MKVIVLGAGASFGCGVEMSVRPPLVNRVLSTAASLGILQSDYAEHWWDDFEAELENSGTTLERVEGVLGHAARGDHLGALRGFVQQQLFVTPDQYLTELIDFETLMGLVEGEVLGMHGLLKLRQTAPDQPTSADMLEQQLHLESIRKASHAATR